MQPAVVHCVGCIGLHDHVTYTSLNSDQICQEMLNVHIKYARSESVAGLTGLRDAVAYAGDVFMRLCIVRIHLFDVTSCRIRGMKLWYDAVSRYLFYLCFIQGKQFLVSMRMRD
jgi:hypothetical protein